MRKLNKWTEKQIGYALELRKEGKTMNQISREMERKFKVKRTGNTIYQKLYKWEKENKEEKNMYENDYEPATRKQCRFYASLVLGENATTKAIKALQEELYKDKALKGQFSKTECNTQIQNMMSIVKPEKAIRVQKNSKKVSMAKWTEEEELYVFNNYKTPSDALVIAGVLNRTERAIQQRRTRMRKNGRWTELQKKVYVDILEKEQPIQQPLPQKIKTFVEKHGNPTTRHLSNDEKMMFMEVEEALEEVIQKKHERSRKAWKYDEEFDLLCNFYELSIDEARERFERSYASLAQRLEMIVDSEEPEYVLMLKRAAKVISKRKKEEAKNAKMGFFMRRKIARKARKARKVARKAERLEAKLNKLRGE